MAAYTEFVKASPSVWVAHRSSFQVPMGAAVWVPITSVVESETLMEQPRMVSHRVADDLVVPSAT